MKISVRAQLYIYTLLALLLTALSITLTNIYQFQRSYRDALLNQSFTVAESLRATVNKNLEFFPLDSFTGMTSYLQTSLSANEDIRYAYITNLQGNVLYSSDEAQLGSTLDPALYAGFDDPAARISRYTGVYFEAIMPITSGGSPIGAVHVGIERSLIDAQITALVVQNGIVLVIALAVFAFLLYFLLTRNIIRPLSDLTEAALQVQAGDLSRTSKVTAENEIGNLARAFNSMTARLRELISSLESRVEERTNSLVLAAEVGRSVSQVRELDLMLKDAVELIRERFDLYYVQISLVNPGRNALLTQAGTGEVGAELMRQGHSLALNTGSINGRAAVEKRSIVISDTLSSSIFLSHSLLPDTRSEMAVPLMAGETVLGVLDLQSDKPDALNQDILPAFEALAGQLTSAIQNANLLAETEQARRELEAQSRRLVRQGWQQHLDAIHRPEQTGFVFEENKVISLAEAGEVRTPDESNAISVPIAITGEAVGSLVVELSAQSQSTQNVELVNIVARQVAQQIENLRLLESAERYRSEAEAAARRSTVEGWQEYVASQAGRTLGYLYDTNTVQPLGESQSNNEPGMTLPVRAREETVAELAVMGLEAEDSEALELASAVADRLGAHIENLRLLEETKRGQIELNKRANELAAVAEISYGSAQELDIQKLLDTVVHLTQRKFGLYHAHVFLHNEASNELRVAACGWQEGDLHEGTRGSEHYLLTDEQALVVRAARTRQAVIANDVHQEPGWLPNPLLPETASEMAIPLLVGDQLLGVLAVQSDRKQAFTTQDANIQTTLASQIATALQNARSFAQAQQQAERESTLNIINQKIQSATSVEAVLQIAARELGHALGAPLTIAQLGMKERKGDGSDKR